MPSEVIHNNYSEKEAAGFTRPLLLTPAEDMKGFLTEKISRATLFTVTCISVLAVLLILFFVLKEGAVFLKSEEAKKFLISAEWTPTHESSPVYGALSLIAGSLYVTVTAMLIAAPVGVLAAVYLSDIAPFKLRQVAKPVIELLAAIPSVAYGFFAVLVLAPLLQNKFGMVTGTNALNASLILAVMALPTIISITEDSLSAIRREIREASYGLGATRAETMIKIVIPAAHSGIIAAVILGTMRAIGETMVVWMASGNATQIPSPWWDITSSVRTMTATIAGEMGEAVKGSLHYQSLFAVGAVLLVTTFVMNLGSEYFLSSVRKGRKG
jgi:phosphate ABC transporter permease protein PstC